MCHHEVTGYTIYMYISVIRLCNIIVLCEVKFLPGKGLSTSMKHNNQLQPAAIYHISPSETECQTNKFMYIYILVYIIHDIYRHVSNFIITHIHMSTLAPQQIQMVLCLKTSTQIIITSSIHTCTVHIIASIHTYYNLIYYSYTKTILLSRAKQLK